mmetsp:Transcript_4491/g.14394  ORF Transcript_4491/g.14394 Transcript_4491/m.14394 type:complete len:298 (+) Transcript_4491:551-1444(+)
MPVPQRADVHAGNRCGYHEITDDQQPGTHVVLPAEHLRNVVREMSPLRVAEEVIVAGLLHLLDQRLRHHLDLELATRVALVALAIAAARQLQREAGIVLRKLLRHRRVASRRPSHPREEEEAVLRRRRALVEAHQQALVLHRVHLVRGPLLVGLHRVGAAPDALELVHGVDLHTVAGLDTVVLEQQLRAVELRPEPEAVKEDVLLVVVFALQRLPPVLCVELEHLTHEGLMRLVNGEGVLDPSQLHFQLQGLRMVKPKHDLLWLPFNCLVDLLLGRRPPPLLRFPELQLIALGHCAW